MFLFLIKGISKKQPKVKRLKWVRKLLLYLLGDSVQSLAADFKQSTGRVRVLAGRLASKHHTGTGQTGPVEDLHTRVTLEMTYEPIQQF